MPAGLPRRFEHCLGRRLLRCAGWVVDAEAITQVDYTAARVVRQLQQDLARRGTQLAFARVPSSLKADVDRHHLTEVIAPTLMFDRLHDAMQAYERLASAWRERENLA